MRSRRVGLWVLGAGFGLGLLGGFGTGGAGLGAGLGAGVASGALFPQPDPVPRRWQLDLTPGPLRAAVVDTPVRREDGTVRVEPRAYVYFTYTVTNYSGRDLLFAPVFEMATDLGEAVRAGRGVPFEVTAELLRRLDNPFLLDQVDMLGMLQQGEENAREGLVVWALPRLDVGEIVVYAAGFSGEHDVLRWKDPESGEERVINLRKTYEMRFATPGLIDPASPRAFGAADRPRWIMR